MGEIGKVASGSGLVGKLAEEWGVSPAELKAIVKKVAFANVGEVSEAEGLAFIMICHEHKLNPILKEIYAFKSRAGTIIPIVPIDGWTKIANRNGFDGCEFKDTPDKDGGVTAVTCSIYVKGRERPVSVTEYLSECQRNTEPWKQWPARMLRHKAFIQACRYAFSLGGIYDPDEAERIDAATDPAERVRASTERTAEELQAELDAIKPALPPTPEEMQTALDTAIQRVAPGDDVLIGCANNTAPLPKRARKKAVLLGEGGPEKPGSCIPPSPAEGSLEDTEGLFEEKK